MFKKNRFDADQVKQALVKVATNEAAIVNNREIPDICLQHLVAVMLVDKTVTFPSAPDTARMKDAAILRHRANVQLIPDDELERRLRRREGTGTLAMNDGAPTNQPVRSAQRTC